MEKTTKKKKSKKGLRKRIGIIAVGGLSLVLTVCLSVGATLAWFAGSTWASESLYMGGPVYVEMAGRTSTDEYGTVQGWGGGDGNLDINAVASTRTGTASLGTGSKINAQDILLPGQLVEVYSQARVYSTAVTDSVSDNSKSHNSSGATLNNTTKENGVLSYRDSKGRVTTTTTSVLRARFSIDIEFDPGNGFNDFTDGLYMYGYPKQSTNYTKGYQQKKAENGYTPATGESDKVTFNSASPVYQVAWLQDKVGESGSEKEISDASVNTWANALGNEWKLTDGKANEGTGRRDGVDKGTWSNDMNSADDLMEIKNGTKKSIYQWKFVSESEYKKAVATTSVKSASDGKYTITTGTAAGTNGVQMGYPFNGEYKINNIGFYGVWVTIQTGSTTAEGGGSTPTYGFAEADAFYKARCNAYLNSYVETYETEYDGVVTRTVKDSVAALEDAMNRDFVNLVNDSSNIIHGLTTDGSSGNDATKMNASWLYIDPTIGNDTNTNEISTKVGGWWYLVEDNGESVGANEKETDMSLSNKITMAVDNYTIGEGGAITGHSIFEKAEAITRATKENADDGASAYTIATNDTSGEEEITLVTTGNKSVSRLDAKLYEVVPTIEKSTIVSYNEGSPVYKVVSQSIPFVNGTFALPSDALTNIFANAKITFKIAFQAVQAFFPHTQTIDNMKYNDTHKLLGTAKALSIRNAIPIFNEAFDYQENGNDTIEGL